MATTWHGFFAGDFTEASKFWQTHPAGSEIERGSEWILRLHGLWNPWYWQCFLASQSAKMCAILLRFKISMFFSHSKTTLKNMIRFLRNRRNFFLFSILSCLRQFMSAQLQQVWVLWVNLHWDDRRPVAICGDLELKLLQMDFVTSIHMESMVPVCTDNALYLVNVSKCKRRSC